MTASRTDLSDANNYAWNLNLNLPSGRTIFAITISSASRTWSTYDGVWPFAIYKDGVLLTPTRKDQLTILPAGKYVLKAVGKKGSATYESSKILLSFDQGDSLTVQVPK